MNQIRLKAYGKINLGLDVLGRRSDGYHEVKMIMQSVKLFDNLIMTKTNNPGITIKTNLGFLPTNENNLVYKAISVLREEFNIKEGVNVELNKYIPVAAGMAGGSADCAAALYGMNLLFELGLSKQDLMDRGVKLGADVPYCILRGTALSEGIGEVLSKLPAMPKCYILIAKPPINVSTKLVYEKLDAQLINSHPNIDGIITGLEEGNIHEIADNMGNILEVVTVKEYPIIDDIKKAMIELGAINSLMSGSGPTVFGLFEDISIAKKAAKVIRNRKLVKQVYVVEPFNNSVN